MGAQVPLRHPLRELFGALTEKSFTEHLGWPDTKVTSYVSNLLVDFTRTDQLYKIRNRKDQPVDSVVDLLFESEVMFEAQSLDREQDFIAISAISHCLWPDCFPSTYDGSNRLGASITRTSSWTM